MISLHNAPEQTGNAPYVASLARGLARGGWSVRVLSAHPHYPQWRVREGFGQWRRTDDEDGVRVERLRHYVPRHPSNVRRLLAELSFGTRSLLARWGRPDAVLLVSPALVSSSLAMARARTLHPGVPVVTWVQDLYSRGMSQTETGGRVSRTAIAAMERALLRSSDRVVVIHDRFRDIVSSTFDVPDESVEVVRNWSHLAGRATSADRATVRSTRGWGVDEIIVVHGGNQGVKQGLGNVVEAAAVAAERGARVRFVLVGHGSQHEELRARAADIPSIEFLPPMDDDDYTATLAAADVLLVNELSGVSDMAVPSKLTTYFRSGRPVIASTDAGSISAEEVERAGAGVRVDADDPGALVDAALDLGGDPDRGARLGASGERFAREHLEESAAMRSFSGILSALVPASGRL